MVVTFSTNDRSIGILGRVANPGSVARVPKWGRVANPTKWGRRVAVSAVAYRRPVNPSALRAVLTHLAHLEATAEVAVNVTLGSAIRSLRRVLRILALAMRLSVMI